jgi:hypothetical protein
MDFLYFLTIYIFSEIFEFSTQKGNSFKEIFSSLLPVYERGILRFLLRNPSFYVVLFAILHFNNYSFIALLLLVCKLFDLLLKIIICDKIINNKPLGVFSVLFMEDRAISNGTKIVIMIIYVTLFYISFSVYT